MLRRTFLALVMICLCLPSVAGRAVAQEPDVRYVATFTQATNAAAKASALAHVGGRAVRSVDPTRLAFLSSPQAAAALANRAEVVEVHQDARVKADFIPNDPCFNGCLWGDQWGLKRVSAPEAWDIVPGLTSDVPIAVLDTGVDPSHPDFQGRVSLSVNFSDSLTASDTNGHGTFVAGIIAATGNNGEGMAGISWASPILSYKVLDDSGNGWISDIAAAIRAAADAGAKVINLSLSGSTGDAGLESAVQYASSRAVVVSAAGNQGTSTPTYPAAYEASLGIGATARDDSRASFSNFGSWVDLSAPGVEILSTGLAGTYGLGSGTSFATPMVAGAAALVWKTASGTDADAVRTRLKATADPLLATGMGAGLINVARATGASPTVTTEQVSALPQWSPWNSLGGIVSSAPDAASTSADSLAVFARGADNALWVKQLKGLSWSGWTSLGGVLSSDPAAVSSGAGAIDVFVRGADSALWQRRWSGNGWSDWSSLGGILGSDPSATSSDASTISVFAKGADQALWQKKWDGASWSGWTSLGGVLSSSPDASSRGSGSLDVFARGGDAALWMRSFDGASWTGWQSLGGGLSSDPSAVSWGSGRIDVFVRGNDGALWQKSWQGGWSGWSSLGGALTSNPAAASRGANMIDVLATGADSALWLRSFGG